MAQYQPTSPPPPPGFNPSGYAPAPQIVTVQLGDSPIRMTCPNCRREVITVTSNECSLIQHIACFIMFITGVCTICSCFPYCVSSLGTTRHECPGCHTHLGNSK